MEAKTKRRIKSGAEYEHLFPRPNGKNLTVLKDAGVEDTVSLIQYTVPLTLKDTEKIAPLLKGKDLYETCRNIWNFVYDHVPYKRDDKGVEQVRRPARVWWDRNKHSYVNAKGKLVESEPGVDCDCYTEFICSILMNLGIKTKSRITVYNHETGFQHIYPVVPKDQKLNYALENRDDYIVIDCVKDRFDDEQPFIEYKDYIMRLEFLNGLDEGKDHVYILPPLSDVQDIYASNDDDEFSDLGKISLKKIVKKVGDTVGKGIRLINRAANPATILLRNAFLLGMKLNFMNVAKRLRYAYLSDDQAKKMGMNLSSLESVRKVKERAETIYWQSGGKKENLKLAILKGKGNKDNKVSLAGFGLGSIDNLLYADEAEYNIIHGINLGGLGFVVAAPLAPAVAVISALAAALKQVKDLFPKGSKEEQSFATDQEDPGDLNLPANLNIESFSEDQITEQQNLVPQQTSAKQVQQNATPVQTPAPTAQLVPVTPSASPAPATTTSDTSLVETEASTETKSEQKLDEEKGFTAWMSKNKVPIMIGGGLIVATGLGFLFWRSRQNAPKQSFPMRSMSGLGGIKRKSKKKKSTKSHHPKKLKKVRVQEFKIR